MLEKTDDPMVWGKTAGRPRNFGQAAENIPGHDTDDAQAEQLDLQAEAAAIQMMTMLLLRLWF